MSKIAIKMWADKVDCNPANVTLHRNGARIVMEYSDLRCAPGVVLKQGDTGPKGYYEVPHHVIAPFAGQLFR